MSRFNFKRLISKYSKTPAFLLREMDGYHDWENGGVWVKGQVEEIEINGAVVPLSSEDLRFGEGGTYNQEDRKLYCYMDIRKGEQINHKDKLYTILERRDYSEFDQGLYIYFMKGVNDNGS